MSIDRLAGFPTDSVIVIKDPLTSSNPSGNHMGYLRSLPYLFEQGITNYTFPPGWLRRLSTETFDEVMEDLNGDDDSIFKYRALPEYPFEYTILDKDQDALSLTFDHICQITTQETDEYSTAGTTHKLLRAYMNGQISELVLVTDTGSFSISNTQSQKPLSEELDHANVLSYEKIAKQYIRQEIQSPQLPFNKSLNIWLHRAAVEYEQAMDQVPNRIADLFEFDELEPGIRTWDLLEFLAADMARENIDHINATVRPWVESDITKVESNIRNALQEFDYDRDAVNRFRETGDRPG